MDADIAIFYDRPPDKQPLFSKRPSGGKLKILRPIDDFVVARDDGTTRQIQDRSQKWSPMRRPVFFGWMAQNRRKWRILAMLLVGIFTQYMIEGVQASVYKYPFYEVFGNKTCKTEGTHVDLNSYYEMDQSKRLMAVGGTTSSNEYGNAITDASCLQRQVPFFEVTKNGERHFFKWWLQDSYTSIDGQTGSFTEILALKFPSFLLLRTPAQATSSNVLVAVVLKFAHSDNSELQYGQSVFQLWNIDTGDVTNQTVPRAVPENLLNNHFQFALMSPDPNDSTMQKVATFFVTGQDFVIASGSYLTNSFEWTFASLESEIYERKSQKCKLKAIVFDNASGLYVGGHVAKLDANGDATDNIVPFIGRTSIDGQADIIQVIDAGDTAGPFYSIDKLEGNVATQKIIGLAVPRQLVGEDFLLSNSGKIMIIIMNTDKDNVSVFIAGFQASGTKGDLYRRPFGMFDKGDLLSFVFVSSPSETDEEAITDIKGPGITFMEIYSIQKDFELDDSDLKARTAAYTGDNDVAIAAGSWEVLPKYADPALDASHGTIHYIVGQQCYDVGHSNANSHKCNVVAFFQPHCLPFYGENDGCYVGYLANTNFLSDQSGNFVKDSLKSWYKGYTYSNYAEERLVEYTATSAASVKTLKYVDSYSWEDSKKVWDYTSRFTAINKIGSSDASEHDYILQRKSEKCYLSSCNPISFANPEDVQPQSFSLEIGGGGTRSYNFSNYSSAYMGGAAVDQIKELNVQVAGIEGNSSPGSGSDFKTVEGVRRLRSSHRRRRLQMSNEMEMIDLSDVPTYSSFIVYDSSTHNIVLNDPPSDFSESWTNKLFGIEIYGKCAGISESIQDYCLMEEENEPGIQIMFMVSTTATQVVDCSSATVVEDNTFVKSLSTTPGLQTSYIIQGLSLSTSDCPIGTRMISKTNTGQLVPAEEFNLAQSCSSPACNDWVIDIDNVGVTTYYVAIEQVADSGNFVFSTAITVTVASPCGSATFASSSIAAETQGTITEFSTPFFTTNTTGCTITYEISTGSNNVNAPSGLTLDTSDNTNIKVKTTTSPITDSTREAHSFYIKATITHSSAAPVWSNELKLYYGCDARWTELQAGGGFSTTMSISGTSKTYQVGGLSSRIPSGCQMVEYFESGSSSASEAVTGGTVEELQGCSQPCTSFVVTPASNMQFYVGARFSNGQTAIYGTPVIVSMIPWETVFQSGTFGSTQLDQTAFNLIFNRGPGIIHRECADCPSSHENIYYVRKTSIDTFDAYTYMMLDWKSAQNTIHVDFDIFSTFEDATALTNPWNFCNFDDGTGFPRDCGPTGAVEDVWSNLTNGAVQNYQYKLINDFAYSTDEHTDGSCQGIVRLGNVAFNTWSADQTTTGAYTCTTASFGIPDPVPGQPKICQCKSTVPSTPADPCATATFANTTIDGTGIMWHTTHWSNNVFTTNPLGCAITYEVSAQTGTVSDPDNLFGAVTTFTRSDTGAEKFKVVPTGSTIQTLVFYVKATIADSSSAENIWSPELKLYFKCGSWAEVRSNANFVQVVTMDAGQSVTYNLAGLVNYYPSAGCDPEQFSVSGSHGSITQVTGATIAKSNGCQDPCMTWNISTTLHQYSDFHFFFVATLPGGEQAYIEGAVAVTVQGGDPCPSLATVVGLAPFVTKTMANINIDTVKSTGNVNQSWIGEQNLVIPVSSYAQTTAAQADGCPLAVTVSVIANDQNLVINSDIQQPVTDLSLQIPQGLNASIQLAFVVTSGSAPVDDFTANITFGYYCDPQLVDFTNLTSEIVGDLLNNATNTTMFKDGLVEHGGRKYPSLVYTLGQQVSYIYAQKCPLSFQISNAIVTGSLIFQDFDKFVSSKQNAQASYKILRPESNSTSQFELKTYIENVGVGPAESVGQPDSASPPEGYAAGLVGQLIDTRVLSMRMYKDCTSSQALQLSKQPTQYAANLVGDFWACTIYTNCTPGAQVSFDLTGSLSVVDDCQSELIFQEITGNVTNYTSSMEKGYEIANSVLKVTIPKSTKTESLTIDLQAVSDKGLNISSGQLLQFQFIGGANAPPYIKNYQTISYHAQIEAAKVQDLVNYTTGDIIQTQNVTIKESEQRSNQTWFTFFSARVADFEDNSFLVEFSEESSYKDVIQLVKNDTDVDLQVNLYKIDLTTPTKNSLSLILTDKVATLNNTYVINLDVFYTKDGKSQDEVFTPTFEVEEEEETLEDEELTDKDDEEESVEDEDEDEQDNDKNEKDDDAVAEGKSVFRSSDTAEEEDTELIDEEEEPSLTEEELQAIEEAKKAELMNEVLSIIDLDIDSDDKDDEYLETEDSSELEDEEKEIKSVDREKEQKQKAVEIIDQMDSTELEDLKEFLKEKATEEPTPVGEAWDEEEEEVPEEEKSDIVEIVEEVVPSKPPGFKEVNPILLFNIEKTMEKEREEKKKVLKEKQKKEAEESGVEPVPPKAVKMKIGGISKDGNMGLGFNQPLAVPSFTDKQGRRRLADKDQIDMSKVIGIKMEPKSDVEAEKLKYYIEIVEWTEEKLDVKVKFKDSDKLSQGETNDQIQIEIKNPGYFASRDSGEVPDPKEQRPDDTQNSVPEQLPDGMSEAEIAKSAGQGKNTGLTVVIIQIVAQIFLKKGMDKMWALFFTLQLVQSITIYSQSIPPVSQVWVEQIRHLVDFEMLKPDPLMQLYDRDLSVKYIMELLKNETKKGKEVMTKNFDASGIESSDFIVNMSTIILIVVVVIVLVFVLIILAVILPSKKLRDKVKDKLVAAKDGFIWNGFIRSQSISYLTLCLSLVALYKDMTNKPELEYSQLGTCVGLMICLVLYPLVIIFYLRGQDIEELGKEKKQAKIGNLIKGVKLNRNKWAKYYYPIFMIRRLLFVFIVMFIPFDSCMQMQALIFSSTLYIIWYVGVWPHLERKEAILEVINEVLMQMLFYHLMVFSDFYTGEGRISLKLHASFSFVGILGLIILINLIYVLVQMFWQIKKFLRLRKLKKDAGQQMELHKGMIQAKNKEVDKIFSALNADETEQERRQRKQREDEEFERNLSAQIDSYEEKHGKIKVKPEEPSSSSVDSESLESSDSMKSREERKELKQKIGLKINRALKKKLQSKISNIRKEIEESQKKAVPKKKLKQTKRNINPGMNMETIQEREFDDSFQQGEVELPSLAESSSQGSLKQVVESSDEEFKSKKSARRGYQLPQDDDPEPLATQEIEEQQDTKLELNFNAQVQLEQESPTELDFLPQGELEVKPRRLGEPEKQ